MFIIYMAMLFRVWVAADHIQLDRSGRAQRIPGVDLNLVHRVPVPESSAGPG
eukprot:SAG31_NODE_28657_length_407_cov_0.331169_1_plen_51_part_10